LYLLLLPEGKEYHKCYQDHVKKWYSRSVTDDAAGWGNMKFGFVSWKTVDAAGWEKMKTGSVS